MVQGLRIRSMPLLVAAALVFTIRVPAQDHTDFMDVAAENLFRYSRAAISGGGGTVTRLRSLALKGRSRFAVDDTGGLAGAAVEIKLLLPDYYLRTDTSGLLEKVAGYAGKAVLSGLEARVVASTAKREAAVRTLEANAAKRDLDILIDRVAAVPDMSPPPPNGGGTAGLADVQRLARELRIKRAAS
jgi:hypothetical protein